MGFALRCLMTSPTPLPQIASAVANPHFARIGGEAAVVRLVDAFYRWMDTLPEAAGIRAMHEADLTHTRAVLVLYLNEWLGGPRRYTEQRGRPALRRKHMPLAIGQAETQAWLSCMQRALDEVVIDAELRGELMAAFTRTAQTVRNDTPHPHGGTSATLVL
jgi:hemoglobin